MDKLESFVNKSEYNIIFSSQMPRSLSGLCVNDSIYINSKISTKEKLQTLAEETAHQETSVGDIVDQDDLEKKQQESLARRLAIRKLITLDDLIAYKAIGVDSIYEAAELSDVTVDFLYKALKSYQDQYGAIFTYKGFLFDLTHGLNIFKAQK